MGHQSANSEPLRANNHYVPRLYLKRWASDVAKVYAYRLLVAHPKVPLWREASLRGVAGHLHLYTRTVSGRDTDEFERWLCDDFETPAESAIEKAVSDDRLSAEDWHRLIRFAVAQDLRTPARLRELIQHLQRTMPDLLQTTLEESVRELETAKQAGKRLEVPTHEHLKMFPARVTSHIEEGADMGTLKVEAIIGRAMWLFQVRHLLTSSIGVMLKHRWTILKSPADVRFVTSDDPLVRLNYFGPGNYRFDGGWGQVGCQVFLPLGPHHLLYSKVGSKAPARGTYLSRSHAAAFRQFTIEHAHRMIFSNGRDDQVVASRPRLVDLEQFNRERREWLHWHEEQQAAEREIFTKG
jgi:hypothetical protein